MIQIQTTALVRQPTGYTQLSYKFSFTLPVIYGTGSAPIKGLDIILSSYPDGFSTEIVAVTQTVIIYQKTVSFNNPPPSLTQIKNNLIAQYNAIRAQLDAATLTTFDQIASLSYDGSVWS